MKGDAVLDYVEFQLTPTRTRCELFISACGVKEKLASGFLKPFITHLEAVEQQVSKRCENVRLDFPSSLKDKKGRCWFTKGTLERFVRFVSTPEVLERVKSIEDELAQLQQVRSLQVSSLPQVENALDSHYLSIGEEPNDSFMRKNGSSQLTKYGYGNVDSDAEASKVELLKAMDIRLLALQQEQSMAFSRALAAGFNSGNMNDLLAFAEYFGAPRLRMACINFMEISKQHYVQSTDLESRVTSSDSDMSLSSASDAPKDEQLNHTDEQIDRPNEANMSNLSDAFSRMTLKTKMTDKVDHDKAVGYGNGANVVEARSKTGLSNRLSVQAAINLFENKQKGESLESMEKIVPGKQEVNKVAMSGYSVTNSVPKESMAMKAVNGSAVSSRSKAGSISHSVESTKPYRDAELIQNDLLPNRYLSSQNYTTGKLKEGLASPVYRSQQNDTCGSQLEMLKEKNVAKNSSAVGQSKADKIPTGTNTINSGVLHSRVLNEVTIDPKSKQANELQSNSNVEDSIMVNKQALTNSDFTVLPTNDQQHDLSQRSDNGSSGKLLGSLWINSLDHDMQALISLVDNHTSTDKENAIQKGRFYEQYTMLRDAKLMKEQSVKTGERESKLRTLIETLRKKKEELDAQAARLSKSKRYEIKIGKYQSLLKSDLQTQKKDQDLLSEKFSRMSIHNSSPKQDEIATSKPVMVKKGGPITQRGTTPPRSKSPKSFPKIPSSSANSRKSSITSVENPLTKSVPCFGTFKKENTKPSPGRQLGSSRIPKNVNIRPVSTSQALELNGDVPIAAPEDKKMQPSGLRKSCTSVNDLKPVPSSTDDVIITAKPQTMTGQTDQYKMRYSVVGSFQESKPFLRKGCGIAPGLGAGMVKQKSSSSVDVVRSSDEENVSESENQCDVSHVEDMDMQLDDDDPVADANSVKTDSEADSSADEVLSDMPESTVKQPVPMNDMVTEEVECIVKQPETEIKPVHVNDIVTQELQEKPEIKCNLSEGPLLKDLICPDKVETNNPHCDGSKTVVDPNSWRVCSLQSPSVDNSIPSMPFREAFFTHHENKTLSPSPADSTLVPGSRAFGSSSPFRGAPRDSLLRSPSLKSPDVHYGYAIDVNKKLHASQKHLTGISSSKEAAKGFKRFLNFGKKSRASEAVTTDEASLSSVLAMSEVDDESEEQSNSAEDKLMLEFSGDQANIQDDMSASSLYSAPSVRSSIPNPPSNFRMREDHLTGSTMLKAPRSFFSLSSFRSKVAEARKVTS